MLTDDNNVYTGTELTYTACDLKERTEYEFRLRAFTEDDEESFPSDGSIIQTFRAGIELKNFLNSSQYQLHSLEVYVNGTSKCLGRW